MSKYAVWIRKFNTDACVHVYAQDESALQATLWIDYRDRGWEVEKFTKIA